RFAQRQRQRAVAAHRVPAEAARPGAHGEVLLDEGGQLAGHVGVHAVGPAPGLLGGVQVEAGAAPEVPAGVVAGMARAPRAGVTGDQHQAQSRRRPLRPRLDDEGLLGAGEAGQIVEGWARRPAGLLGDEDREAHGAADGRRGMAVKALHTPEAALLREGLERGGHENSTTVRIDWPACMRSKASLMRASGSLWVMRLSMSILPFMYQSTIFGTSVRPRAPPKAVPLQTRPVTSWNGRVRISWPAPATPMMIDSPQPRWQHSSAWRISSTLPTHSKL